jgi:hypothetical protein
MLYDIKRIFLKHKTKYRIVISPLYDQQYFNPKDLEKLQNIFGKMNVFDLSGKNQITEYKGNYYQNQHYKIFIGREILKTIYGEGNN